MKNQSLKLVAKTFAGLENILADELTQLGAGNIRIVTRAVEFSGNKNLIYKANLLSRTAINILRAIESFEIAEQQDLYNILRQIEWDQYFDHSKTIAVKAVIFDTVFDNSHFVELRSKDAIADYFNDKYGARPNVDKINPDIKIAIHISKTRCKVSLDSSGPQLFKRNYRKYAGEAPLNEVLAAGLIKLSGWNQKSALIDPMCGSGTIPIEAAMIAQNIPAGKFRKNFSFINWKDFDAKLFESIKKQADEKQQPISNTTIEAYDISGKNIAIARQNILKAGLLGNLKLQRNDFFNYKPQLKSGILIINPPYGKRIGEKDMTDFYKRIGDTLKKNYEGFSAWIISQYDHPLKFIGLKPSSKITLYNGPVECRFLKFEIYRGSFKQNQRKI